MYYPTFWDWATFVGTIGLFLTLLFLFIRFLPMISIFEMRTLLPEAEVKEEHERERAEPPDLRPDGRVQRPERAGRGGAAGARGRLPPADAYTPFPIEELAEAIGIHHNRLPLLVLIGGIIGGLGGFGSAVLDVGDRLPAQRRRPAAQQLAGVHPDHLRDDVLVAALTAVLGMLALNGLPMPYHPVFNVPRFALASRDRFFLCIEATDPQFDRDETWRFLERLEPRQVSRGGSR